MPYKGYGQYCPLALAAELLCERWTLLVISRVIDGCTRFNEIHRGVPKISATLLSQRLLQLEEAGLIVRIPLPSGRGHLYELTEAGSDLAPIIMNFAVWGQKWAREMVHEDLDPAFLAWSMHTRLNIEAMPGAHGDRVRVYRDGQGVQSVLACQRQWQAGYVPETSRRRCRCFGKSRHPALCRSLARISQPAPGNRRRQYPCRRTVGLSQGAARLASAQQPRRFSARNCRTRQQPKWPEVRFGVRFEARLFG